MNQEIEKSNPESPIECALDNHAMENEECEELAEILDSVPEGKREIIKQLIVRRQYSGPMPPPEMLAQYNDIIPNAAERILVQFEQNSEHERYMKKSSLSILKTERVTAQWMTFIIVLALIALTVWLVDKGHIAIASIVMASVIVPLAWAFLNGRKRKENETDE